MYGFNVKKLFINYRLGQRPPSSLYIDGASNYNNYPPAIKYKYSKKSLDSVDEMKLKQLKDLGNVKDANMGNPIEGV